jgi:hypothetical protein
MADATKFPYCGHRHNCPCAQGVQSYVPHYQKVLEAAQPIGVYEWGPGKNTEMALQYNVKNVVSVEQEKRWIPDVQFKRQTVLYMKVESEHYITGYPGMFESGLFDLFFVDSRRRAECVERVYQYAREHNEDTVLCLHDAQRSRYHAALSKFEYVVFPHKGFAVATNSPARMDRIRESLGDGIQ